MKKIFALLLIITTLFAILVSCSHDEIPYTEPTEVVENEIIKTYDGEYAPMQIIHTGDTYYALFGKFNGDTLSLTAEANPLGETVAYRTEGDVWSFSAEGNYAVWCEKSEERCAYKYYSSVSGEVGDIFLADITLGYQCSNIGIYGDFAYYTYIDYAKERASVMRAELSRGVKTELYTFDYKGELSIMDIVISHGHLVVTGYVSGNLSTVITPLTENPTDTVVTLPSDIAYVYSVGYDAVDGTLALYVLNTDGKERIIYSNTCFENFDVAYTFAEGMHAYKDRILVSSGVISLILHKNRDGYVADNFSYLEYDTRTGTLFGKDNTFWFDIYDGGVYLLSFNTGGEYTDILYSRVKSKDIE